MGEINKKRRKKKKKKKRHGDAEGIMKKTSWGVEADEQRTAMADRGHSVLFFLLSAFCFLLCSSSSSSSWLLI